MWINFLLKFFVIGLQACSLIKKRLQLSYFPVNIAKFLRAPVFTEYLRWLLFSLPFNRLNLSHRYVFLEDIEMFDSISHINKASLLNAKAEIALDLWYRKNTYILFWRVNNILHFPQVTVTQEGEGKASFQGIFWKILNMYLKINDLVVSYNDLSDEIVLKKVKALFLMRQINETIKARGFSYYLYSLCVCLCISILSSPFIYLFFRLILENRTRIICRR